ncbi:cytochrome c/c1 heme lyase [Apiospora arundinis]
MPGNFLRLAALAGGANALALRAADGGCEMTMSTSGSVSYPVSQHGSGQTKAGQGLPPTTFKMDGNGGLTDANGRGCWWTPPTNVLQCDVGQPPAGGFKVDCSGQVTYQGSSTFYQCKVPGDKDKSVNIYNKPNQGQDCKEIKLNANGNSCKPASCTNTNTVPPGYGVQTPPAPPASTVTVPGSAPPAPPPQTVTVPGSAPPAQTVTVPGSAPPAKTVTVPGSAPPGPDSQTVYSTVPGSAPPAPPAKTVTVPGPAPPPQTVTGQCPAPPAPQTVTGQCPTPPAPQTVTVNGPAPPAATVTGQCPAPPPAQTITVNGPAPPAATVTGQCPAPPPAQTVTVNGPAPPAATVTGQCPAPPAPQTVTVLLPATVVHLLATAETVASPLVTVETVASPPGNGGNGGSPPGNGNGGSPPAQQSPPAQPTTLKPVPSSPTGGYPTQPTGGNGNGGNTPGQGGNGGGNGGNGGPPPNQVNIPGSCPGGVRNAGELTLPNLIIPVDSTQPQKKAGTSFNGQVSSTISSVFNFDIPASLKGKTCTVKFLFPEKKTLETSDFSFSGSGALDFSKLSKGVDQSASYATLPSGTSMGSQTVKPGNAYTVGSFPCPGGDSVAIKMSGSGSTSLTFFEDYNPCPIGLFITTS